MDVSWTVFASDSEDWLNRDFNELRKLLKPPLLGQEEFVSGLMKRHCGSRSNAAAREENGLLVAFSKIGGLRIKRRYMAERGLDILPVDLQDFRAHFHACPVGRSIG